MKINAVMMWCACFTAGSAFGATGFFGDHVIVAGNTNYVAIGSGTPQLSDGFGSLTQGGVFNIQGFKLNTWEDNGSAITYMNLFWSVDNFATTHQVQIHPAPAKSGNDRFWEIQSATQNLLNNNGVGTLANGNYTFRAFWEGYTNGFNTPGNIFQSNGGSNYTANFTVVPEPTGALACLLIGAGLMRRIRRSA